MYVYINKILKAINSQHSTPTKAQLLAIRQVLLQFEKEYSNDRNCNGKLLIKPYYIDRRIKL